MNIHKEAQELVLASATSHLIDKKISPIVGYEFDFFIDQLSVAFAKFQFLSFFVYNFLYIMFNFIFDFGTIVSSRGV